MAGDDSTMTTSGRGSTESHDTHHDSYRGLLHRVSGDACRAPDAIVVPAARDVGQLATAADLADNLGSFLVVLCSGAAGADDVVSLATTQYPGLRCCAVDLPDSYEHQLLKFETSFFDDVKVLRLGDLSMKRNLGLLLARLMRWQSVMFLDDDIQKVHRPDVARGVGALGSLDAVGLIVDDYPDNSVVCHANRLISGRQDVFASGAALIARGQINSFFPEIYNEDWLFMFGSLALGRVAATGPVWQVPYDPFAKPERAEAEEFGDLLAEGLVGLLQERQPLGQARDHKFWTRCLEGRRAFIESIMDDLHKIEWTERHAVSRSLKAAEARRSEITAESCASYVRTWLNDRNVWARRMAGLDRMNTLNDALEFLDLKAAR